MASDPAHEPWLHAAALFGAVALALGLGLAAPDFGCPGARGALLGRLALMTVVMGGLPALTDVLVSGRTRGPTLADVGLSPGKSRRDLPWIGLALAGAIAAGWVLSRSPAMMAAYSGDAELLREEPLLWAVTRAAFAAHGLAWETAFRGFLVLRAASVMGAGAGRRAALVVLAQTCLYTIGHLGKPTLEIGLAIPAGVVFGLAALRTRSVLPGFLVHFSIATSLNLFCL